MSDDQWHKCSMPFPPRRDIKGRWIILHGQVWRRRRSDGKWEYQQDDEKPENWLDWQV